jgi:hypothetical protein
MTELSYSQYKKSFSAENSKRMTKNYPSIDTKKRLTKIDSSKIFTLEARVCEREGGGRRESAKSS